MLAHKAEHDGIACVEAIVASSDAKPHKAPIPACIYASPQVASVGLTEEAARAAGWVCVWAASCCAAMARRWC
ncbi:hypothetical protein ACFSHQ_26370 [Gemmobacter lanyuensis]